MEVEFVLCVLERVLMNPCLDSFIGSSELSAVLLGLCFTAGVKVIDFGGSADALLVVFLGAMND